MLNLYSSIDTFIILTLLIHLFLLTFVKVSLEMDHTALMKKHKYVFKSLYHYYISDGLPISVLGDGWSLVSTVGYGHQDRNASS